MTVRKLHYLSGLILSLFIGLHLFNHTWSLFGAERHIELMRMLRPMYRSVFVETFLFAAVLVQIISGFQLFRARRKIATTGFDKLHIWSGLYLAFFFVIHLSAVLVGRYWLELDTNFYFGVAGLNSFPINLFFIPYYSLAILSFFGHLAAIHHKKMKGSVLGIPPKKQAYFILILGLVLTLVILYGLTDQFEGVRIPIEYEVLTGK
jgi:hypothetical protein